LGVIQLCTFILLLLSGERDFAVSLNKAIVGARLPSDFPRTPTAITHFDFLAIIAYRVIVDGGTSGSQHLAPVRECLLTALANTSPFTKGMGMHAAMCLVRMFEKLADPRILFSSENVCRLVHLLLETFNNIIQYQFESMLGKIARKSEREEGGRVKEKREKDVVAGLIFSFR
jgi:Dyggve-Melchior-Clausen syndrome protein